MKIGMNLLLYTTAPDETLFPTVELIKGMGYDGCEWPLMQCSLATAEKIKKFNQSAGLASTTVFVFGPGTNPISDAANERKAALDTLREKIEITQALGASLICGPLVQTLGHFTGKGPTPTEWSRCVEYLKQAGEIADKHKVDLVIEYLNRFEIYFLNTAADAAKLCKEVNHPRVKTMIDSFHANIEEKDLQKAVTGAKAHLAHVHISENDRGVPGSSRSIAWDDLFKGLKEIGYDGWLTIESFGQFLPDLAAAAKIWRSLFHDPQDVCRDGLAFIKKKMGEHRLG